MYLPPQNAYRLMNWLAICGGFKGIMLWNSLQDTPETIQKRIQNGEVESGNILSTALIDYALNVQPQWNEFSNSFKDIKQYERLILALKPVDSEHVKSEDRHVFFNSFTDHSGRRFLVVVNGLIGEWGNGKSPDWTSKESGLSVGEDGNLTGFTPLNEQRIIEILAKGPGDFYDLRNVVSGREL